MLTSPANAGDRYASPPPIVMSPNLTEPWVMQLKNRKQYSAPPVRMAEKRVLIRRQAQGKRPVQRRAPAQVSNTAPLVAGVQRKIEVPNINPIYLPQTVAYNGTGKPGDIVISTQDRFLYLVMDGGKAKRYGVGVGKDGFRWSGTEKISRKAEWPGWTPPAEMIAREKKKGRILPAHMPGGPKNPLGARALYLGSTLYRIHGTNQPWTIGQAVSSGCIRMRNEDVTDLYDRIGVGTKVMVL